MDMWLYHDATSAPCIIVPFESISTALILRQTPGKQKLEAFLKNQI